MVLVENYPMRAQDQGFHDVVVHGGGGWVSLLTTPEILTTVQFCSTRIPTNNPKGYCTDLFIDESIRFIKENKEKPFFCYVPLNALHAPFTVDQEYSGRYHERSKRRSKVDARHLWDDHSDGRSIQLRWIP